MSNISNGQSFAVTERNESEHTWVQMKVAEVCGEEVKSITQHQAKRLPISVINFMLPISVAKREQGMDICKIILRF